MKKYIFKRLLMALGIVLFVILLNYVIIHLAPGDPVRIMAGFDNPSQEQMDALTQEIWLGSAAVCPVLEIHLRAVQGRHGHFVSI